MTDIGPGDVVTCVRPQFPCPCCGLMSGDGAPSIARPRLGAHYRVLAVGHGSCTRCRASEPCLKPVSPDLGQWCWPISCFVREDRGQTIPHPSPAEKVPEHA